MTHLNSEELFKVFDNYNWDNKIGSVAEDEIKHSIIEYIKTYTDERVREARLDELELCLDAVNKLDVDDHINLVYNPYIDHHNKRIAQLTQQREEPNDERQ